MTAETSDTGRSTGWKLGWLIVGRLLTALLLLIFGVLWNRAGDSQQSVRKSLVLLSVVAILTAAYSLILRLSRHTLLQAKTQIAVDVLLVTWLVWNSDVIHSPYVALYIVIIAISSTASAAVPGCAE